MKKVAHSSSDLIKERNGGSVGTITREGDEGEDGGRGVPHQLLEASRKMLSSPRLPDDFYPLLKLKMAARNAEK